jgi:hypothetical protein
LCCIAAGQRRLKQCAHAYGENVRWLCSREHREQQECGWQLQQQPPQRDSRRALLLARSHLDDLWVHSLFIVTVCGGEGNRAAGKITPDTTEY